MSSTPRGSAVCLCIASHNVRSLSPAKAATLGALWHRAKLDIVFLQETWLSLSLEGIAATRLRGWTPFWAHAEVGEAPPTARGAGRVGRSRGVAVLIRSALLGQRNIVVHDASLQRSPEGRLLLLDVDWAGHRLCLVSAYLPSGNPQAQRDFIAGPLQCTATRCVARGRCLVLAGDFNFVPDAALDRLPANMATPPVASTWQRHLSGVTDVYRRQYPRGRHFTHFHSHGAARLDRVYVSTEAVHFCKVARLPAYMAGLTDHRPVGIRILPNQPCPPPPRKPPRVRLTIQPSSRPFR